MIDTKLTKVADAIEAVGISDTLADRLSRLEQARDEAITALKHAPTRVKFTLEVVPTLVRRWQELVLTVESIALNPVASRDDIEAARAHLRALLGVITLVPEKGVLWAHRDPNAKGLTEVRPLDGLRINSPISGNGGRIAFARSGLSYVGRSRPASEEHSLRERLSAATPPRYKPAPLPGYSGSNLVHPPTKRAARWATLCVGSGGALLEKIDLYVEPFPLVA